MSVKFSREFYGWDRFSKMTLIVGILLFVTRYAWILGLALIIFSILRSKSTKLNGVNNRKFVLESTKRRLHFKMKDFKKKLDLKNIKKNMELFGNKIKKYKPMEKFKDSRKYIIINCPKCEQKLRLPRGKGKIIVTCSKCSSEFRIKT
jgi:hypothetical protein